MKTKLTLLLLFFCLLPMAAQVAEDDKYWTADEVLEGVSVGKEGDSPRDVLVSNDNTNFTIYTPKGLAWVAKVTNDGSTKKDNEDGTKYYPAKACFEDCTIELGEIAGGKLDISGHKWVPIGNIYNVFIGTFDGKSQEITGLRIKEENVTVYNFYGLFGCISGAIIKNLGIQIKTFSIDGGSNSNSQIIYVGGIAGLTDNSEISNCYVYGDTNATIEAKNIAYCSIGGLRGVSNNEDRLLKNSYSMINIIAESNKINYIGGIAGINFGTLSNTFATGSIVVNSPEGESFIGGICGVSYEGTLKNNLALNKGGITVKDNSGVKVHVARIGVNTNSQFSDNYAIADFLITGQDHIDNSDADGTTIGSETDLAAILNGGSSGNTAWSFPEGGGLPCLNAFGEKSQPAASAKKEDFEVGALDLATFKTDKSIIYLKYIKENGWYVSDNKDTETAPFNGEISGTGITKEVYITGGADSEDVPTLTVGDNLEIANNNEAVMEIKGFVNLIVAEGKKLNISGKTGLVILEDAIVNLSQTQLSRADDKGITISNTQNNRFCIENYGTFNIANAEVTAKSASNTVFYNKGTFNIALGSTLNILTPDGNQPIIEKGDASTFTLAEGATFRTGKIGDALPVANTLTYSSTSEGTLSITDQNGIDLPSTSKIGAGTELTVTVSGNTKEIGNVIYTQADGTKEIATLSDIDGTYTFTMPAAATTVSVKFKADPEPEPEPDDDDDDSGVVTPTVYYTVTLPEVEGATLDPGAGDYDVESWSTFRFYLTLAPEYDQSLPIVTTDRGETIAPRQSDGAYLVKYVRTNVAITIDGIVKNPDPVANDAVDADNITIRRTADGLLIHVPSPETLTLYTFAGTLVRTIHLPAGDTRIDVPTGTYIVRVGTKVEKVIL